MKKRAFQNVSKRRIFSMLLSPMAVGSDAKPTHQVSVRINQSDFHLEWIKTAILPFFVPFSFGPQSHLPVNLTKHCTIF